MNRGLSILALAVMALLLLPIAVQAKAAPEVAVVRSDWKALEQPVPVDSVLDRAQIEVLVRRAIAELGGISRFVKPEHRWVVIKPNIVETGPRGSGDITDSYVVWALVKMVHEAAPVARITIAEGPASWISPGHPEVARLFDEQVVDGFEVTGYREILADSTLAGAKIDLVDLNFDESIELAVSGGGTPARSHGRLTRPVLLAGLRALRAQSALTIFPVRLSVPAARR